MCKAWCQIAYDKSLIKYAGEEEFSEIIARGSSEETVQNFLQAVKWSPCLFQSIDLCCAKTTWETFCHVVHNCAELKILNMAGVNGETHELQASKNGKTLQLKALGKDQIPINYRGKYFVHHKKQ